MLSAITAVAGAITALVTLAGYGIWLWRKWQAESAQKKADLEADLAFRIQAAKDSEERKKLSEELDRLRSR